MPFVFSPVLRYNIPMYDQTTRINAMISYWFLAPFFLLAKKGTPFAQIVLMLIVTVMISMLLLGAYRAYRGLEP